MDMIAENEAAGKINTSNVKNQYAYIWTGEQDFITPPDG